MVRRGALLAAALALAGCGAAETGARRGLLEVGEEAPDFMALDQTGRVRQLRLLRRRRAAVVFFYPRDGTPGCTEEACAFRDAWDRIDEAGATVVGISADSPQSHAAFADGHELQFTLLSDPDGEIMARYGVPSMLGLAARVTFLIGSDGRVARVYPNVDPGVHVEQILRDLAEVETSSPSIESGADPEGRAAGSDTQ
jgi:peroxiredoxin Q/BCP